MTVTRAPEDSRPDPGGGRSADEPPAASQTGAPSGYTVDAFHKGAFHLVQPVGTGHRAGMDAMLLAATVPDGASGVLADLGAGAGGAGLAAISRLPQLDAVLIERSPVMADCARRSLALAENARLAPRVRVIEADVTLQGSQRRAAGLADHAFDYVILNPPFNAAADRRAPDTLRAQAHAMDSNDLFERWLRTAAAILKPGGQVSIIARPHSTGEILAALGKRFGGAEITPVIPRPGDDAIRILLTAIKGSRARLSMRDRILIHQGAEWAFSEQMDDLANGRAAWPRRTATRPAN
jgi:tRNA1(Val) A37 N6-methylase TrmN6